MLPPHKALATRPLSKTSDGHPMVPGDLMIKYPHGPQAMEGITDSKNRPSPGHPAPHGGAPNQMPGKPLGSSINATKPTL